MSAISTSRRADAAALRVRGAHERSVPWWRRGPVLGAGLLTLVGVAVGVTHTPVFRARSIEVRGADRLADAYIVRTAGLGPRTNTVYLDVGLAEAALEEDPWVAQASVSRRLPSSVDITIRERVAVAAVVTGSGYRLLAGDGVDLGSSLSTKGLPAIEPADPIPGRSASVSPDSAATAATAVRSMPASLRPAVQRVLVDADGSIALELRGGTSVAYGGPVLLAEKAVALTAVLRWAERERERVDSIDVRAPESPVSVLARDVPTGGTAGAPEGAVDTGSET